MINRGKFFAAAAVPLIAAGAVLTAGGPVHAATQTPPVPIGNSITASRAVADNITDVTATIVRSLVPTGISVVGFPRLAQFATDTIQFGATDSMGDSLTWSLATGSLPGGWTISSGGLLTPVAAGPSLPAPVTFTLQATDGEAVALATVTVTGVSPSSDLILVTPDTVALDAPVNSDNMVLFPTEPPVGVTQTLTHGPAGAVFSDGVLSVGTAIPGRYRYVTVTATDVAGATAHLTFTATVAPVFAPVPVVHHGHAVSVAPTRENVYFIQSGAPSWDHFIIVGPGPINGHEGWVYGQLGLNVAVYSGLESGHGYTVFYHPVIDQGSDVPVPGSHGAHVFFITARH